MKIFPFAHPSWLCLFAVLLLACTGCGASVATGKLFGKVSLDGAPFARGTILVITVDESGAVRNRSSALIGDDGSYETGPLPLGSAKILLQRPPYQPPATTPPGNSGFPTDPVPARYRSLETTDLKHVVAAGAQQYDVNVTGK